MSPTRYETLTWLDVGERLRDCLLIVPVGSIEQHGPHLPFGVDTVLSQQISIDIAESLDAIVAPVITYGARSLPNSGGGLSYPGTIYIQGRTLIEMYADIISSYITAGAKQLFLLNGHWENEPFLVEAVEQCRERGLMKNIKVLAFSWWSVLNETEMTKIFGKFPGWHAEHAGQAETALMLHYAPEQVYMDKSVDHYAKVPPGIYQHPTPDSWTGNQGVLSLTTHVTAKMGEELAELVKQKLLSLLQGE